MIALTGPFATTEQIALFLALIVGALSLAVGALYGIYRGIKWIVKRLQH